MSHLIVNGVDKTLDHIKIKAVIKGLSEPLCGIGTYKDTLDLSTGVLTRYVKKLVLTGVEEGDWTYNSAIPNGNGFFNPSIFYDNRQNSGAGYCTHYPLATAATATIGVFFGRYLNFITAFAEGIDTADKWKSYLAAQYANGTPIVVWYILSTPETEQITVPSHLTGTVEGYLTQTGTPTPTNPIYPTANGEEESGGTYSIDTGEYIEAWEARDKSNHLLWGRADAFTGTNSISARCYGLPVKSWEIDGNSQQSGTPSPQSIIMPEFVGERTENLWSGSHGNFVFQSGKYVAATSTERNIVWIPVSGGETYSFSISSVVSGTQLHSVFSENPPADNVSYVIDGSSTFINHGAVLQFYRTAPIGAKWMAVQIMDISNLNSDIMFNTGSTPLPYEPHGYKLTITSANQTVPVYLGQVQTVRRVKKLVLTGAENWDFWNGRPGVYYTADIQNYLKITGTTCVCSHYPTNDNVLSASAAQYGVSFIYDNPAYRLYIVDEAISTTDALKSYLAAQYAAGTPVVIWYVLASEETGTINEPLCRIGTYADTLTSEQAGITIPTTDGSTTIAVDTSLAPSKFEIKVHAKPIHYGFKIDKAVSDPSNAVIYTHDAVTMTPAGMDFTNGVFDYGSWENVWFIKGARPVMLNFDGTEAYDLDPNDYSKKLDGTPSDIADSAKNMNAMIAFPTVWIKRTDDASYNYIEISDQQIDSDFHAYAHEDASGVVKPYIYLPIYKGSMVDGKLRSISGVKPQSGTTAQQEVDAASALGTGWQIWDYTSKEMLCDLLTLISKSLDTQGKVGQGHSTGGSSASDFLNCGTLNDKGKFFGYSATTSQVKCFGMEALWAERWDRELGLILDAGIYKIKEHPAYNLTGEGYTAISTSVAKCPTSNDYIKTEASTQFGSLPTVVGGTQSTYYCDYFYQNQSGVRVAFRGGTCYFGAFAGLRCVSVNITASTSIWSVGASPVYK